MIGYLTLCLVQWGLQRLRLAAVLLDECEHFGKTQIRLIDFDTHMVKVAKEVVKAISNVRFGYEDEEGKFDDTSKGDWADDHAHDLD
jgi:hypothetical protein